MRQRRQGRQISDWLHALLRTGFWGCSGAQAFFFLASGDPHELTALPITSAGRFRPLGPVGISNSLNRTLSPQSAFHRLIRGNVWRSPVFPSPERPLASEMLQHQIPGGFSIWSPDIIDPICKAKFPSALHGDLPGLRQAYRSSPYGATAASRLLDCRASAPCSQTRAEEQAAEGGLCAVSRTEPRSKDNLVQWVRKPVEAQAVFQLLPRFHTAFKEPPYHMAGVMVFLGARLDMRLVAVVR